MTCILGLSAFYHDSAAALIRDGEIIAAAQEERFTRIRHDSAFPSRAVEYCLRQAGIGVEALDAVAYYEKPLLKAERLLETYLGSVPHGLKSFLTAIPTWLREKNDMGRVIRKELGRGYRGPILYPEHHESHAASAFYPSPFDEAAILTIDGVGEWATTTLGRGAGNRIELLKEIRFPHSLGMLYSAFTYYTGFKVNSGEYKVMGLAPYGEPKYRDLILERLIRLEEDGSFWLNQDYFDYCTGLTMTNPRFHALFGGPPREPESLLTQREMDLAASVQAVTEEVVLRLARECHRITGSKNLCMAGGVALNCVANGRLLKESPFERIWIQPAAGDAGGALGAALLAWHQVLDRPRTPDPDDSMRGAWLGPEFTDDEIAHYLAGVGVRSVPLSDEELLERTARYLADEKVIGWFQGRMEFGPRALGARSILGDPRSPRMQAVMNKKIKFREGFRPFAPVVLRERVADCFEMDCDSPYMLLVAPVHPSRRIAMSSEQQALWGIDKLNVQRSDLPAVTHVDYSARVQTVTDAVHGPSYRLLKRFEGLTGCPVLVNTSFNVRGEPIVCTPEDAYRCFMFTHMDVLVMGRHLLLKSDQPPMAGAAEHLAKFPLD